MPKVIRQPDPEPEMDWEVREIFVSITENGRSSRRTESAVCLGDLAVHASVDQLTPDLYCVTHIPSGLSACKVTTDDDAVKIAELLWAKFRDQLEGLGRDAVRKAFPRSGLAWIAECAKQKKYVSPKLFFN